MLVDNSDYFSSQMDVINLISKVDGLPDAPVVDLGDPTQHASIYYANGPRVHQYVKEMNEKVLSRMCAVSLILWRTLIQLS